MITMTKGKFTGLQRLSDDKGIIAALAIDQRGSMVKMISKAKGHEASVEEVENFKTAVSRELTPYASAILLDLQFGTPAIAARNEQTGLLLSYEKTGYDVETPGRLPDLIDDLSALRIKEHHGDAVKILIYYDPYEPQDILELKHAWVERIGAECKAVDIPFFLEPITYDHQMDDMSGIEYARKKPQYVNAAIEEFSKPRYGVDVLKLEVPINIKYVEGYTDGEIAYTKEEAIRHFHAAADLAKLPFIYLSAGVTAEQFRDTIALATEAGTPFSGVLCGRATWQNGVAAYGLSDAALDTWLKKEGTYNITALNELLAKGAVPWWTIYGGLDNIEVVE